MQVHLHWGKRAEKKLFAQSDGSSRVRNNGQEDEVPGSETTATKKQATVSIALHYNFFFYKLDLL